MVSPGLVPLYWLTRRYQANQPIAPILILQRAGGNDSTMAGPDETVVAYDQSVRLRPTASLVPVL
jgi:hypothetical protein